MAVGALNEQLAPVLSDYLISQGYLPGSAEFDAMMKAGSTLVGGLIGKATGGDQGAATGASIAYEATTENYLKHDQAAAMKAAFDKCKANPKGCSDQDVRDMTQKYQALSQANIDAVNNCIRMGDAACVTFNADKLEEEPPPRPCQHRR